MATSRFNATSRARYTSPTARSQRRADLIGTQSREPATSCMGVQDYIPNGDVSQDYPKAVSVFHLASVVLPPCRQLRRDCQLTQIAMRSLSIE